MLLKKLKIKLLQKQKKVENKVVTEAKKVGNKIATEAKAIGNDLKALVDMNYEDNICDSLCVEDTTEKTKKKKLMHLVQYYHFGLFMDHKIIFMNFYQQVNMVFLQKKNGNQIYFFMMKKILLHLLWYHLLLLKKLFFLLEELL